MLRVRVPLPLSAKRPAPRNAASTARSDASARHASPSLAATPVSFVVVVSAKNFTARFPRPGLDGHPSRYEVEQTRESPSTRHYARGGGVRCTREHDSATLVRLVRLGVETRVAAHPGAHRSSRRRTVARSVALPTSGAARRANPRPVAARQDDGRRSAPATPPRKCARTRASQPRLGAGVVRDARQALGAHARQRGVDGAAHGVRHLQPRASEGHRRCGAESERPRPRDADPPAEIARSSPRFSAVGLRAAHHGLQRVKVSTDERARARGSATGRPCPAEFERGASHQISERGFRRPVTPRRGGGEERLKVRPLDVAATRREAAVARWRACSPRTTSRRGRAPARARVCPRETPLPGRERALARERERERETNAEHCRERGETRERSRFARVSGRSASRHQATRGSPRRGQPLACGRWRRAARLGVRATCRGCADRPTRVPRRARSRPRPVVRGDGPIPSQDVSGRVGFSARAGRRARRAARPRAAARVRPLRRSPHPRARRGATGRGQAPPPGPPRAPGPHGPSAGEDYRADLDGRAERRERPTARPRARARRPQTHGLARGSVRRRLAHRPGRGRVQHRRARRARPGVPHHDGIRLRPVPSRGDASTSAPRRGCKPSAPCGAHGAGVRGDRPRARARRFDGEEAPRWGSPTKHESRAMDTDGAAPRGGAPDGGGARRRAPQAERRGGGGDPGAGAVARARRAPASRSAPRSRGGLHEATTSSSGGSGGFFGSQTLAERERDGAGAMATDRGGRDDAPRLASRRLGWSPRGARRASSAGFGAPIAGLFFAFASRAAAVAARACRAGNAAGDHDHGRAPGQHGIRRAHHREPHPRLRARRRGVGRAAGRAARVHRAGVRAEEPRGAAAVPAPPGALRRHGARSGAPPRSSAGTTPR